MESQKSKRVRRRKADLMLQAALNDAETLAQAEPTPENVAKMKLAQVRLTVLTRKANRERLDKFKQVSEQFARTEAENVRLKGEVSSLRAEVERLKFWVPSGSPRETRLADGRSLAESLKDER